MQLIPSPSRPSIREVLRECLLALLALAIFVPAAYIYAAMLGY